MSHASDQAGARRWLVGEIAGSGGAARNRRKTSTLAIRRTAAAYRATRPFPAYGRARLQELVPSAPTPSPQDFRSGGRRPPARTPVGFRTFTQTELADNSPPDMSGARGGDVVLMSGNLWLKLSVDGG